METEIINHPDGSKTETSFDNLGNQTQVRDISKDGKLTRIVKYIYDDYGNIVEWREHVDENILYVYKVELFNGIKLLNVYDKNLVLLESTIFNE